MSAAELRARLPGRTRVMPILDADGRLVDFASLDTLGGEKSVTMKLSDWVFRLLADSGVKHVFMVTGGGAMHLNDSLGQRTDIEYVCTSARAGGGDGGGVLRESRQAISASAWSPPDRAARTRSPASPAPGSTRRRCWCSPARRSAPT